MSRKKNVFRNLFWSVIERLVMVFTPFLTRTALIYTLGMEYEGIKSLFTSLLHVLSFSELGIGSALVFSMYRPMAENDEEKVCALLNLYKKAYRIIGCVILVVGLTIMPFLKYLVAGDVPADINIYKAFSIYLFNNAIGYFLFTYQSAVFTSLQRVDILSKVNTIIQFVLHISQIAVLLLFRNYYVYAVVLPISTIASNLCIALLTKRYYPQYRCRGALDKNELKEIGKKVFGLFFQRVGGIVLSSADTIVISAFLGLRILGIYNGYYYVISALLSFLKGLQQGVIPSIGNSIIKRPLEDNYQDMKTYHFLYTWLITWCSSCLLCLYQPFIQLWQGSDNMLSFYLVVLFSLYFYVHHMSDIGYMYKEAIGLWWQGKFIPIISAVVNLTLNIILIQRIGLAGVLLSTIISIAMFNNMLDSWIVFKYYYKSIKLWLSYIGSLAIYFCKAAIAIWLSWLACSNIVEQNIISLFIRLLLCSFISIIAWLLLNISNKNLHNAFELLKSVLHRFN